MLKHKDRYVKLLYSEVFEQFLFGNDWDALKVKNEFEDEFEDELVKNYRHLYTDIKYEEAFHQIRKVKNHCIELFKNFTPYEIVANAMNSILLNESDEIKVQYEEYLKWIGYTNKLSEDILVGHYIVDNYMNTEHMKYIANIRHDNTQLESILRKGLAENHMHYNASTCNKHFNYFALVINENMSFKRKCTEIEKLCISKKKHSRLNYNKTTGLKYNLQYLLYLRKYIEAILNDTKEVEKYYVSYEFSKALTNNIHIEIEEKYECLKTINPNTYHNVIGKEFSHLDNVLEFLNIERQFVLEVIEMMRTSESYKIRQLAMQYLYLKNYFEKELLHKKKYLGFTTFSEYEEIKDIFYADDKTLKHRYRETLFLSNKKENIDLLEYRTTQKNFEMTAEYMRDNIKLAKANEIKVGNVIHYIKKQGYTKRNINKADIIENRKKQKLRDEVNITVKNSVYLKRYSALSQSSNSAFHLLGIDTANVEIGCRPEVYAQLFRSLTIGSRKTKQRINLTYHVGEEFESLISGIRSIDEVLEFYPMKYGDRLGHALALGKNVESYYKRTEGIYTSHGILLDDLTWLFVQLKKYSYKDLVFIDKLEDLINYYLKKIKRSNIESERFNLSELDVEDYYASMMLRSDNPINYRGENIYELKYGEILQESKRPQSAVHNEFNINNKEYKKYFDNEFARFINYLYHFDEQYNSILDQEIVIDINEVNFVKPVEFIQQKLREKVDKKGIGIEVNISSNYIISDFDLYKDHPLFVFTDARLFNGDNDMLVSINTDDAGVFDTSLYKEYSIIAKTLEEEGFGSSKILEYLEHLIKMSREQSWIYEK